MSLVIQQCLQFLYSLGLGFQDKVMFFIGQRLQIPRSIVVLNAIKMMDNPTFWQWFTVKLFPYKDVFKNIIGASSGVVGLPNYDIPSRRFNPTPLATYCPLIFAVATTTSGGFSTARFPAIEARMHMSQARAPRRTNMPSLQSGDIATPFLHRTYIAICGPRGDWLPASMTGLPQPFPVSLAAFRLFGFIIHTIIIAVNCLGVKHIDQGIEQVNKKFGLEGK